MSKTEQPKQQQRLSPELSEFLHMLKALEKQDTPKPAQNGALS